MDQNRDALFQRIDFIGHSGRRMHYKIECDSMTDGDWETMAFIVCDKFERLKNKGVTGSGIKKVIGVPRGGLPFANAITKELEEKRSGFDPSGVTLIVDDVLTTGGSMSEAKANSGVPDALGVVAFARGDCPAWIKPIFVIDWWNTEDEIPYG